MKKWEVVQVLSWMRVISNPVIAKNYFFFINFSRIFPFARSSRTINLRVNPTSFQRHKQIFCYRYLIQISTFLSKFILIHFPIKHRRKVTKFSSWMTKFWVSQVKCIKNVCLSICFGQNIELINLITYLDLYDLERSWRMRVWCFCDASLLFSCEFCYETMKHIA